MHAAVSDTEVENECGEIVGNSFLGSGYDESAKISVEM